MLHVAFTERQAQLIIDALDDLILRDGSLKLEAQRARRDSDVKWWAQEIKSLAEVKEVIRQAAR